MIFIGSRSPRTVMNVHELPVVLSPSFEARLIRGNGDRDLEGVDERLRAYRRGLKPFGRIY